MDTKNHPSIIKTNVSQKTISVPESEYGHDDNQIWDNIRFVKDCLYGYCSSNKEYPEQYQNEVTKALLISLKIKSGNEKTLKNLLNEIIKNFRMYDYNKRPNWSIILDRIGNRTRQEIYLDFVKRLIGENRRYTLLQIKRVPVISLHDRKTKYTINQIVKQLKLFVPDITAGFVKALMRNEAPRAPLTWTGSQYEFDYFVRSLPGLNYIEYKKVLGSYFVFPNGPASVRRGGSFINNHNGKPYKLLLDDIINNLKLLK